MKHSLKKRLIAVTLSFALFISAFSMLAITGCSASEVPSNELHGVWVSVLDFSSLGLSNKSESAYRKNVRKFISTAEDYDTNAIFLHVRAYDDAIWPSKTFKACSFLNSKASSSKTAAKTYSYDALKIFIEEAHDADIELHAWLNPYRINASGLFLDPAKSSSQNRVKKAIKELLEYNVDGIHFDDYFYHGSKYCTNEKRSKTYSVNITALKKRKNVNKLVRSVYKQVHKKKGVVFGISPQGNYDNDMNSGADVKTWLTKSGCVDYVVPQIYWSDKYGSSGSVKMYSQRLELFSKLHTNKDVKLYIGLALYRCGSKIAGDPGWKKSNTNLKSQVKSLRKKKASGYILFSGRFLYNKASEKERDNLADIL